jgi:hypothetical protein
LRRLQLLFGQGNFKWLARAALDFSAIGRPTNPADRGRVKPLSIGRCLLALAIHWRVVVAREKKSQRG